MESANFYRVMPWLDILATALKLNDIKRFESVLKAAKRAIIESSGYGLEDLLARIAVDAFSLGDPERVDPVLTLVLEEAKNLESPQDKIEPLTAIAWSALKIADTTRGDSLLQAMIREVMKVYYPWSLYAIRDIMTSVTYYGDARRIESTWAFVTRQAKTIDDPFNRAMLLHEIADTTFKCGLVRQGDSLLESAILAAKEVDKPYDRLRCFHDINYSLLRRGDTARADSLLTLAIHKTAQIERSHDKASCLLELADMVLDVGDTGRVDSVLALAIQPAMEIDYPEDRVKALYRIAEIATRRGDRARIDSSLTLAIHEVAHIDSAYNKEICLARIVGKVLAIGDSDRMTYLLTLAIREATSIEDAFYKAWALHTIAECGVNLGDRNRVNSLLMRVIQEVETIDSPNSKASALREIAEMTGKLGATERADSLITHSIREALKIDDPYDKVTALCEIAKTAGELGARERVDSLMARALKETRKIDDYRGRMGALYSIADIAIFTLGEAEQGDTLLGSVLEEAGKTHAGRIERAATQASVLSRIAKSAMGLDDTVFGEAVLASTFQRAMTMKNPCAGVGGLVRIAHELYMDYDKDRAMEVLSLSLETAKRIRSESDKSEVIGWMSWVAGSMGNVRQAYDAVYSIKSAEYRVRPLQVPFQLIYPK